MSNINYDELMKPVMDFLGCETPKAWLTEALNNLDVLMQDHANCEKKAAGTAMNLMFRYSFFTDLQVKLAFKHPVIGDALVVDRLKEAKHLYYAWGSMSIALNYFLNMLSFFHLFSS